MRDAAHGSTSMVSYPRVQADSAYPRPDASRLFHALPHPLRRFTLAVLTAACGDDSRSPLPTQPRAARPVRFRHRVDVRSALSSDGSSHSCTRPNRQSQHARGHCSTSSTRAWASCLTRSSRRWKKFVDIIAKVDDDFHAGTASRANQPADTGGDPRTSCSRDCSCARGFTAPDPFGPAGDDVRRLHQTTGAAENVHLERRRLRRADAARNVLRAGGDRRSEAVGRRSSCSASTTSSRSRPRSRSTRPGRKSRARNRS